MDLPLTPVERRGQVEMKGEVFPRTLGDSGGLCCCLSEWAEGRGNIPFGREQPSRAAGVSRKVTVPGRCAWELTGLSLGFLPDTLEVVQNS